jgi:hypothetical protein
MIAIKWHQAIIAKNLNFFMVSDYLLDFITTKLNYFVINFVDYFAYLKHLAIIPAGFN